MGVALGMRVRGDWGTVALSFLMDILLKGEGCARGNLSFLLLSFCFLVFCWCRGFGVSINTRSDALSYVLFFRFSINWITRLRRSRNRIALNFKGGGGLIWAANVVGSEY
jgi:hypothetical protein